MPSICGPKNSRYTYTGNPCPHMDLAFVTDELHLRNAILQYEKAFNVSIKPHIDNEESEKIYGQKFGQKYFIHTDNASGIWSLVDLHIIRGDVETCPKQDLDQILLPSDIVEMGELVC